MRLAFISFIKEKFTFVDYKEKVMRTMKRCVKCLMADTKPGVALSEQQVCKACLHAETKAKIDWKARWEELKKLCDKHRSKDGSYDVIVTGSAGKDSVFQTKVMKMMGMHPLLLTVATNYEATKIASVNMRAWNENFDGANIVLTLPHRIARIMTRKAFEQLGNPDWYYDRAIYVWPIREAIQRKIKLVIYGENVNVEYNGIQQKESPSALSQIENGVILGGGNPDWKDWLGDGITMEDMRDVIFPSKKEISDAGIEPTYLSYFVPWDGYRNYLVAKRAGYHNLGQEWKREGLPDKDNYHQTDTIGYNLSGFMKYQKFGFGVATDVVGWWRRHSPPRITLAEAKAIVRDKDHELDQVMVDDFVKFTGYSNNEFYKILDKWYNKKLFKQDKFGCWTIKDDGLDSVPDQPNEKPGFGFRSTNNFE
jgi:N-acetyl sugar amidotransferase